MPTAEFSVHEVSRVSVLLRGDIRAVNFFKMILTQRKPSIASSTLSALRYQATMRSNTSCFSISQTPPIPVFALNSSSIKAYNHHSSSIPASISPPWRVQPDPKVHNCVTRSHQRGIVTHCFRPIVRTNRLMTTQQRVVKQHHQSKNSRKQVKLFKNGGAKSKDVG